MDKTKSIPDMFETLELMLIDIKNQIDIIKPRFVLIGDDISFKAININDNGSIQKIAIYPHDDGLSNKLRMTFYFKNGTIESASIKKEYFKVIEHLRSIGYIVEDMRTTSISKPEWVGTPIYQQK